MSRMGLLVLFVICALPASAQAAPQDVANEISSRMMSRFCDGVTLHDCPSKEAAALRQRIAAWAEEGYTVEQIETKLEEEYGESVWATPPVSGWGLFAWLLPALATIAASLVAWHYLRRWAVTRTSPDGYDADEHITAQDRRRLDAELAKLRGRRA